ncbi:MAG: TlpA family protein disulfide reductase [Bacteroidetes bacterium]|nr:TlpA family protein disulfide reductase [Bacteroidota bacterium]
MGKYLLSFAVLVLFAITIVSCSNKNEEKEKIISNSKAIQPEVKIIDASQLRNKIENRYGRTLFINVWATWSEPSLKELPDIQKLFYKYKDEVDFLNLSVDLTSKIDSVVLPFLEKAKFNLPVFVIDEKNGIEIMKMLSPKWNGGIPASFIFNKYGRREIFILGRQTFDNISKGIDSVNVQ